MKFYFVYMQDPNNQVYYNIGDFGNFDDAMRYASDCKYPTRIKQVGDGYSSVIMEGELFGRYEILQQRLTDEV
jgi:hypothetical protein